MIPVNCTQQYFSTIPSPERIETFLENRYSLGQGILSKGLNFIFQILLYLEPVFHDFPGFVFIFNHFKIYFPQNWFSSGKLKF